MKIPQDKRSRQYELTYLVPASLTSDEMSQVGADVEKLVKKHKGSIVSQDDWGKRDLAYTIQTHGKRYDEAAYKHLVLEFDTAHTVPFEKDIYLNGQIIRHLLVVAEDRDAADTETAEKE